MNDPLLIDERTGERPAVSLEPALVLAAAAGPSVPVSLFHWSPSSRRNGIRRRGLVPGLWSTDREWKAPYIALSWSPSLAWALSGMTARGAEHDSWDLWTVLSDRLDGMHVHAFEAQELRVFERIYKRDVWYVATRDIKEDP